MDAKIAQFVVYVLLRCVSVYGVVQARKIVDFLCHPTVNTLLKAVNTLVLPVTQILYTVLLPTFPSHVSSTYLSSFPLFTFPIIMCSTLS